jgi:hypothetical protein
MTIAPCGPKHRNVETDTMQDKVIFCYFTRTEKRVGSIDHLCVTVKETQWSYWDYLEINCSWS